MTVEFVQPIVLISVMFLSGVIGYVIGMRHAWKDADAVYKTVNGIKND